MNSRFLPLRVQRSCVRQVGHKSVKAVYPIMVRLEDLENEIGRKLIKLLHDRFNE